jgi:hypothetical protein
MRWNEAGRWVWSDAIVHEPLISAADFEAVRAIMADAGRARRTSRETHQRITHPNGCEGGCTAGTADAGCKASTATRLPTTAAATPGNVYLREADLLPVIDRWLLVIFAPHRLEQTIREMQTAQDPGPRTAAPVPPAEDTQALIADCDTRLARYQAVLDAGADPQTVAEWPRQVKSERVGALTARRS